MRDEAQRGGWASAEVLFGTKCGANFLVKHQTEWDGFIICFITFILVL